MHIDSPDKQTDQALAGLIEALGLAQDYEGSRFAITGADSPRVSTLCIGSANAVAMLAAAAGVAAIWRQRNDRPQDVSVEVGRALYAAHT